MEYRVVERKTAQRYPTDAKVIIHRQRGTSIFAVAVDISSSGMFVHLDRPRPFRPGETVTVDVELPPDSGQLFSTWGTGTVERLDGERCAIQICADIFDHGTA
jgi:hypothetical protein